MSSMMQQYTRENTRLEKLLTVNPSPTQQMSEGFGEIEITEELLSDGKKIGEAIKKLDFVSIAPLNEAEQVFFESMLAVSEDIMDAFRQIDKIESDILAELVEEFRGDLMKIKTGMEKSLEARPIFRYKLGQFLRLKMALLNHLVVEDEEKPVEPRDAGVTKNSLEEKSDSEHAVSAKFDGDIRLEKVFKPGETEDPEETPQHKAISKALWDALEDEEEDELTQDEQEVTTLLTKGFDNWQLGQLNDDTVSYHERQTAIRKARLIMKRAAEILRDPKRSLSKEFRTNILKRTESAVASLKRLEKTEQSLHELHQRRKFMETGVASMQDLFGNYDPTVDKERGAAKAVRRRPAPSTKALAKEPTKALVPVAPRQPSSKAVTFADVIADMDPSVRQVKALENLVRERLSEMRGGVPVDVKFLRLGDGKGLDAVDLSQLDKIKKSLTSALFATQLQNVFQQSVSVNELEDNYNLDEDGSERSSKKNKKRSRNLLGL